MQKYYISFGYTHKHELNGIIFDKDCLVEVEATSYKEARQLAFKYFKNKWSLLYSQPKLQFFPRGIIKMRTLIL